MNKKTWLIIAIISAIWICLFPLVVFGESSTYVLLSSECTKLYEFTDNNRAYYASIVNGSDVRALIINENGSYRRYFVSENSFSYHSSNLKTTSEMSCGTTTYNATSNNVNGSTYYIASEALNYNPVNCILPIVNDERTVQRAVYYTFGDGSVGPIEPTNWGSLKDLSYTTAIAGGGSAAVNNKDILSWDTLYDTNYNDISGEFVKIRVLKGSYRDSTKADLLTQAYNAIIEDTSSYNILGTYPVRQGKISYEWSYIMNRLDYANIGLMLAHPEDDYWIKKGWIYQAQLIADNGEYQSEWQTLYTVTSASAKASEVIINSTSYDIDVYQVVQQITEANNNTTITITYNDTDITIQNPSDGTEPSGGTNLWDILKELVSGIFQIIAKLGDLVGNLIDGIMGLFQSLFTPPEVDQQINNDINIEINSYLEDDQPGLNDIHTNIDTWKLQLEDIAEDYAAGGDCILQWDNVSMDLSVFGAGNVTFIPAGTYDLKTAFLNLLSAFGVSYSTYQMLVSAVIYISLIVLISHKVKGFLKT